MEQSPLGSTPSETEKINTHESASARSAEDNLSDQREVADRLLAALASGNLEHLTQAREAFLAHSPAPQKQAPHPPAPENQPIRESQPTELTSTPAPRSVLRHVEQSTGAADQLRAEEQELRRVEVDLERRRAEVAVTK